MDWQTFCDIKKLLNEECGYAYRKGTLTLEPPRARFSAQQSVSSAWSLKASILAHLVEQLSPYSKNGTSSGLGIVVHQNAGYALAGGSIFRTADIHISVSAAHNLDVRYDTLSATGASLVVGVVTQADQLPEAVEGVDEWFAGNKDVMQVLMVYCDAARVARCQAQGKARGQHTDNEQVGAVWRWGRDTRGGKILLKEIVSVFHSYSFKTYLTGALCSRFTENHLSSRRIYRHTCHTRRFRSRVGRASTPRGATCRGVRLESCAQCRQR